MALAAALVALLRLIPAPAFARFEARHPRLAALYRALRKLAPDVLPAAKALAAAVRGAPPVDPPRLVILPSPPAPPESP